MTPPSFLPDASPVRPPGVMPELRPPLTQEHSLVEEQVAAGLLTPAEARVHPQKNVITRALGTNPILRVDLSIENLQPRDVLVLTTDGLTNMVSDQEIAWVVGQAGSPQAAVDQLIALANQRGGPDNITVVIRRF